MPDAIRLFSICLLTLLLTIGCVTIPDNFKQPGVSVLSITPKRSNTIVPAFEIKLKVTNPNREAIDIKGLTYTIHLLGNQVVEGVANNLPLIPAYGEAEVTISAKPDLLAGLNLVSGLLADPYSEIDYEFRAEIDFGAFIPMIEFKRVGVLSLP